MNFPLNRRRRRRRSVPDVDPDENYVHPNAESDVLDAADRHNLDLLSPEEEQNRYQELNRQRPEIIRTYQSSGLYQDVYGREEKFSPREEYISTKHEEL